MKKIILSIAILLTGFSAALANRPMGIRESTEASFNKEFSKATEVSWSQTQKHIMATFCQDNQVMYAYYDFNGNLMGVVHYMLSSSLPENLQKDIKKHYSDYWVSELFEVNNDEGTRYYIQLNNADGSVVLSSDAGAGWNVYKVPVK